MNRPSHLVYYLILLSINCFGQDNHIFNTRHLSVEDGLLGRRISAMVQDRAGFIWIATNEGLNRFDGYTFEHYTKSSHGLNANNIDQLAIDEAGDIWITYRRDRFFSSNTQVLRPSTQQILSLREKLGTQYQEEHQALRLSNNTPKNCMFLNNGSPNNSKVYIYKNDKISQFPFSNLVYNEITDELWNINRERGKILKVNLKGEVIDTLHHPTLKKIGMNITNKGGTFLFGQKDEKTVLFYKKVNTKQFKEITLEEDFKELRTLTNSLLIDDNLYFEFDGKIIHYNTEDIFERPPKRTIFDNQGNLWLGMVNGVIILSVKPQRFSVYLKDSGIFKPIYDGRGIWANDDIMLTISNSGSFRYDLKNDTKTILHPSLKKKSSWYSITRAKDGSFWIGTKRNTIVNLDIGTSEILQTIEGPTHQVWSLLEDKNGRIWIGQANKGLYYFDKNKMEQSQKYTQINGFDDFERGKITHIVVDKRDNNYLWLSCQSGWYRLHLTEGLQLRYWSKGEDENFKIPADEIHFTYQDANGDFWLATAYLGLVKIRLNADQTVASTQQFTITEGLTSNTVYAIYEDGNGFLWMSTNNGINRFNKKTHEVQAFLEEDGLPHYEFNRLSSFQREDGTIFFGTLNGIVSFHPDDLSDIKVYDVPLKISRCEKFSEAAGKMLNVTAEVFAKNKIIIAPNERLTNLYVSIQNYADALKTKYVYRIKGIQNEFIAANKNEIALSGLPYGKYQLEIKAKAPDGRFSESVISIPLVILRPFYLRWWFILLALISLALSIWQIFQIRTKTLQNRKKELEEVVKARTEQLQQQATQLQLDKNTIEAQAKELRSLDEMKSRFFANISHELRTPLTLILSPVQSIIKRQKTDNRDFTSAQIINQNTQKLLKRINEILDLTKLEAQEMALKPQPTPFYEFNKRLVATFESLAAQKEQRLTFQYQLDKDLNLLLDQDKYEHIFNNYLSNAIKFTPRNGQIDIQLTEKYIKNSNEITKNQIVLAIADNGLGIPKQDIPKIFNRFFQSSNNQNKSGGSGIGLSLSKEIAQLMKGNVYVESEVGKGSTFYFEMPYVEELRINNEELRNSPDGSQVSNSHEEGLNIESLVNVKANMNDKSQKNSILLVEDNPQLRNYIQLILQEKYNIITAENGKVALEQLLVNNYELIISDIMMPIMDGFELLEQLKSSDQFRHIPVVMLTARSNANDKLKALRIGVDDYILKPFNEEELMARIDNLIANAANRTSGPATKSQDKTQKSATPNVAASDLKWLESVEKHLKSEISNSKFNIDSLAEVMQMSRSHLHRRIKLITGLTPNKYFREIKLQAAREILENGDAQTVSEVCYAVGFDTPKYFSKVFEQRFGKRPISYLKRV